MTDRDLPFRVANPKAMNCIPKGRIAIFPFELPIRNRRIAFRKDGSQSSLSGWQSESDELLSERTDRDLPFRAGNPKARKSILLFSVVGFENCRCTRKNIFDP